MKGRKGDRKMNRKQMVKSNCANYKEGFCLFRDTICPLVSGFTYRGYQVPEEELQCNYFNKYIDPKKEVSTTTKVNFSYKSCKRCEKSFKPTSRGARYCSDFCRTQARKETYRKVNSKRGK